MNNLFEIIMLSLLPIAELRGGIPLAIYYGYSPLTAFLICTLTNMMVAPIGMIFLETLNNFLLKIRLYNSFFHRNVERARRRIHPSVEKYGYIGLMIFVAIPLPFTGAYSGTLGAWALGMEKKKSILFIILGVIIAGIIVTLISYFGIGALNIFIKKPL